MSWFWYVARDDELFIDLDGRALMEIAIKRIERAKKERPIAIRNILIFPSNSKDHFHLTMRLTKRMDVLERMVWQLFFMDQVYRSVKNLFRALDGVPAPSLLISPQPWNTFWRKYDAVCDCPVADHKNQKRIVFCPAHIQLRGEYDPRMVFIALRKVHSDGVSRPGSGPRIPDHREPRENTPKLLDSR